MYVMHVHVNLDIIKEAIRILVAYPKSQHQMKLSTMTDNHTQRFFSKIIGNVTPISSLSLSLLLSCYVMINIQFGVAS